MSTFKKVISLVLCVAMLAGTFAFAGDLSALIASAEEEAAKLGAKPSVVKYDGTKSTPEATDIMSYADLESAYGTATGEDGLTDGFLYIATEYYEADGAITDYYVQPGDKLTAKVYIKSNMKTGDGYVISFYNNTYWDVKLVADGATTDDNGYTSNYSGGVVNPNHPAITTNGYSNVITSINITKAGWIKNTCGFDASYLAATDLVQTNTSTNIDVGSAPYQMTSDEWVYSYYVTVKSDVAQGTEIVVESPDVIWQSYINGKKHDARKRAYIGCGHITNDTVTDVTNVKTMANQMDSGALDYFINGLNHTFIIGEPAEEKTYAVDFSENNGEKIGEAAEYKEGESVVFPAASENQIAWAIVKEGMETPGTLLEPDVDGNYSYAVKKAGVSFMRVLAEDTYDVELSLGSDVTVDETKLPDGVTYNADKKALVIALPVGGSFDLATIPADALSKKGNEFVEWDVAGVTGVSSVKDSVLTLGNVNGTMGTTVTAKLSAKWEPATYNFRFFSSKEAYENGEAPVIETTVSAGGEYDTKKDFTDALNTAQKFAGWYAVGNDDVPATTNYKVKDSYYEDTDFYAAWSDYANMATFMVRDYENGEGWVTVFVDKSDSEGGKTIYKNALNKIKDDAVNAIGANFVQLLDMDPDLIPEGETMRDHIVVQVNGMGAFVNDLVYSGHNVYYIVTTLDYSVTWKVPVYDEETKTFSETETTDYPVTVSTAFTPTNGLDPYYAVSKFNEASVTNPIGWEISGWIDEATGEEAVLNEKGQYVLQGVENKEATLKAVYSLIEYPVTFSLNNGATPDIVTMVGTVSLGDSIVIDGAEFTLNGEASALPIVDVENSEQPDGGYRLPDGYIFKGWTLGSGINLTDAEFPVTLTETIIKMNLIDDSIRFTAKWDAKEFTLKFYILNAAGEEELYGEEIKVKVGEDLSTYKEVSAEKSADINSKAPEGKAFSNVWINKETGESDTMTKMPAKDVSYVASYVSATIKVYIDYNHLETADLSQSMKEFKEVSLTYGQDITEVKSEAPYYERSFETVVKRSHRSTQPVDPSEVIGWNIYHVAAGADPYTADWKSGVNDAGTNIASTTLIFQPIWKAHKDMLFRVYDTDDNIYLALGKDLKLHFWNSGNIVDSLGDTQYNTNPELNVVLFFTMEIENWNWSEFFNIDMWSSLTLRFDAFPIPKSVFTIEGMIGIFQMLGNLIGSLF